jgi:hypothetical protein
MVFFPTTITNVPVVETIMFPLLKLSEIKASTQTSFEKDRHEAVSLLD